MTPVRRPSRPAGERGMALISALLMMMVMSALAIALTASGRVEVAMGDNEELYARARAAAEAGLNHGAAIVLGLTSTPTYPLNDLLLGPDGARTRPTMSAASNADNGLVTHLIRGGSAWPPTGRSPAGRSPAPSTAPRSASSNDDDPTLKNGVNFTNTELTAMSAGNPTRSRTASASTTSTSGSSSGPRASAPAAPPSTLEQMLMPIKMPALLVNGDLTHGGNAQHRRRAGQRAREQQPPGRRQRGNRRRRTRPRPARSPRTTAGMPASWTSGGMPIIPVPDIHAIDYFNDADFVLRADGGSRNQAGTTIYCNAASSSGQ